VEDYYNSVSNGANALNKLHNKRAIAQRAFGNALREDLKWTKSFLTGDDVYLKQYALSITAVKSMLREQLYGPSSASSRAETSDSDEVGTRAKSRLGEATSG
jgi:hypothetical protein